MKRLLAVLLALVLVFGLVACGNGGAQAPTPPAGGGGGTAPPQPPAAGVERFIFSTSNPGGVWYVLAGGISALWNQELGDRWALDSIASGGSVENTRRLASGEADVTMTYTSHMYEAYHGTGILAGRPSPDGLLVFQIYEGNHAFVTLYEDNIRTMSDLEGRSVVLGPPGSGTSDNSRRTLAALGITVQEQEMSFADGARALQDGIIEALGLSGHPSPGVVELANVRNIWIIPFTEEEIATVGAAEPHFRPGVLPVGIYDGVDVEVPVVDFSVWFAANRNVPEDAIYELMVAFFSDEGWEFLRSIHVRFGDMYMGQAEADRVGLEFHPGALRFFDANPQFR